LGKGLRAPPGEPALGLDPWVPPSTSRGVRGETGTEGCVEPGEIRSADRLVRMERAVIVEGARTPIGKFLGSLAETPAVELGATAAKEALRRAAVAPETVDQTVFGHARQAGNGPNTARQVSIHAGVPEDVSAFTVNIACGSGMKAVQLGAQQIGLGDAEVVLAGGMENMTRVPFLLDRMRVGYRMGNATAYDAMYRDGLLDPLCGLLMGETAENLVDRYDISREEQDEFALESQRKAASGASARATEIVPIEVKDPSAKGSITVTQDEHPRPDTTAEGLARLAPVFREGGSVTPGNSAGITDGAAAMVLMSESRARAEGRDPLARIVGMSWAGVPPQIMGIGPVPATTKVLEKTGLSLADIDLIEINEAFAAQVIACERELKFDRDRLNLLGGGISLGHPIGMSGARILLSLAYQMRERDAALGLATLCISGGQGLAVVLERISRR
jgi:acetyl-CoA C-acetyltransferase